MSSNTLTIHTNFNTSPYYDDYNPSKGFYRILFKPSVAVQARELTQLQTNLQDQIQRFGSNIFQDGTLIYGGAPLIDGRYHFVKIRDNNYLGQQVNISNFANTVITGETSGVSAVVLKTVDGSEATPPDLKTLYVKYLNSGSNNTSKTFATNEIITTSVSGYAANTFNNASAFGSGLAIQVSPGVFYAKGFFINFPAQTAIVSKYDLLANCQVGFLINESIVNALQDTSLNDPANGSSNFAAPGADRFHLEAELVSLDLANNNVDFAMLYRFENGILQQAYTTTQYSVIQDEWARRTFDTNGNYVVSGMGVSVQEHLNTGTNGGLFTLQEGGNTQQLAIGVAAGKAFVLGYEITTLVKDYVFIPKGIDTSNIINQTIQPNYGNYIICDETAGTWPVNDGSNIKLYDTAQRAVSSLQYSTGSPTGKLIGTANIRNIVYDTGTVGSNTAQYRVYLTNIVMTGNTFSNVKSLYYNDSQDADSYADVIQTNSKTVLNDTNFGRAVFQMPISAIKTIRDSSGVINTAYTFSKKFEVTIASDGTFTLDSGLTDETFPYAVGALDSTQKNDDFIVTLNGGVTVSLTGTVTVSSGSAVVTGSGTAFTTQLSVGDKIQITASGEIGMVQTIANNTSLTLTKNIVTAEAGSAVSRAYLNGDIINFSGNGVTASRSVSCSSSTSLAFDMGETLSSSVTASVVTSLQKSSAREIKKTLRPSRYIQIRVANSASGNTGPWDLGFSDIYKLRSVRKSTSTFSSLTDGNDMTANFKLDNGQRDDFYNHGKLVYRGANIPNSSYLLVEFDYFYHDTSQGIGYYSIDSYPIDDVNASNTSAINTAQVPIYTSPSTGVSYDLRNSIDMRPTMTATATDTTSLTGITINPAATSTFDSPTGGLHTLVNDTNFTMDLSYYLPRKDVVSLDAKGNLVVTHGIPATLPVTPTYPDDTMALAVIDVTAYPSLSDTDSQSFKRVDLAVSSDSISTKGYTMRDINALADRISNLEYYTLLSLLEQDTQNMVITDADGLNRFKNGFLIDSFNSFAVADTSNPDFSASIDTTSNELRPMFTLDDIAFTEISTSNVVVNNPIYLLNYTSVPFITQPTATTTRNTAGLVYNYVGTIILDPTSDYWVDTTQAPSIQVKQAVGGQWTNSTKSTWSINWGDWKSVVVGKTLVGSKTKVLSTKTSQDLSTVQANDAAHGWVGTEITSTTSRVTNTYNETINKTRSGIKTTTTPVITTQSYGDNVIDVSVVPYVRAQIIKFQATGLKPSTQIYLYFDNRDMSTYSRQSDSNYNYTKSEGAALITDSSGKIYGTLRIPDSSSGIKFNTGTISFRLTDSPTNDVDATTSAETQWTATGIQQTKQNTIVSTENFTTETSTVNQTKSVNKTLKTRTIQTANTYDTQYTSWD